MSVVGNQTRDVRIDHCDFRRIGRDSHAHMIYCAYGPQRITVADNHFEDCTGDFVRFRDRTDYGIVWGNQFVSTATYKNAQPPMVTVPLFNDEDPAATQPRPAATQEYFGTHFLVAHNLFRYAERGPQDTHWAMLFHHSGYDPPGRAHLLSPRDAATLARGTPDERRAMLRSRMGIDLDEVHLFGNDYEHVKYKLAYRSSADYGAKPKGFFGAIDLSDLVNERPAVTTLEEAVQLYADKGG
jgi:hypothetical protein